MTLGLKAKDSPSTVQYIKQVPMFHWPKCTNFSRIRGRDSAKLTRFVSFCAFLWTILVGWEYKAMGFINLP